MNRLTFGTENDGDTLRYNIYLEYRNDGELFNMRLGHPPISSPYLLDFSLLTMCNYSGLWVDSNE